MKNPANKVQSAFYLLGYVKQQFAFSRLGYILVMVGAMFATITTAKTLFQVILFSQHNISLFVVVKVNPLNQWLAHSIILLVVQA